MPPVCLQQPFCDCDETGLLQGASTSPEDIFGGGSGRGGGSPDRGPRPEAQPRPGAAAAHENGNGFGSASPPASSHSADENDIPAAVRARINAFYK
jgi:hypothetical protein